MLINTLLSLLRGYHVDLGTVAAQVISILFVILCILPLHELAHAWVANKLGDPTAKAGGAAYVQSPGQCGPYGALALLLFGFGWAKPVPVDSRYFRKPKEIWPLPPWLGRFPTCWLLRRGGLGGGYGGVLPL